MDNSHSRQPENKHRHSQACSSSCSCCTSFSCTACNTTCGHQTSDTSSHWKRPLAGLILFAIALAVGTRTPAGIVLAIVSYFVIGWNILADAASNLLKGKVFDENFLMGVATLGALALGEYAEAVSVLIFFQIGEILQERAVYKTRESVTGLMDLKQDYAHLIQEKGIQTVPPAQITPGQKILVRPGEKVPLDGVVTEGHSHLDASALTGEFIPLKAEPGTQVLSGSVNQEEALTIQVTKTWDQSTVSRILKLVQESAERKTKTETFIRRFARWYTPSVLILALLIAVLTPLLLPIGWTEGIRRALILLVISCPCALVISIPLSYFAGIGRFARHGILLKGSNYLDALTRIGIVVFDKTGTLTGGKFTITRTEPANGFTDKQLLRLAALAESTSNHPIAQSILAAYDKPIPSMENASFREIAGRGTAATLGANHILAGNAAWMQENGIDVPPHPSLTGTIVHIAVNNRYAGNILLADSIKPDSLQTIRNLKSQGIAKIAMLTGDSDEHAQAVSKYLHIKDCYSQLLPEDKVRIVERLQEETTPGKLLAFVGDGINDAPALTRADIGISTGSMGSDAAMEASDIVLMSGEPSRLPLALRLAHGTRRIILQNIVFILGIKGIILMMAAAGEANMWEAIFADVGISLLAILNAIRPVQTGTNDHS